MQKTAAFLIILMTFLCLSLAAFAQTEQSSWEQIKLAKRGSIDAYWYDSNPFIFPDKDGKPQGIEYDIMIRFQSFLKSKYDVQLQINWIRTEGFVDTYEFIRDQGQTGSFGMSAFSITPDRLNEVDFTPPYMDDISVLVSSKDVPIVKSIEEFKSVFSSLKAVTIDQTTYVDYLNSLQSNYQLDFDIKYIPSSKNILVEIANETNAFGYIDLPNYLMWLNRGVNATRQNMFAIKQNGYAIIFPKSTDWAVPINEYFESSDFKEDSKQIISSYLGKDVYNLMDHISHTENEQIILLTKEKEIQDKALVESALKYQKQTTLRNLLIVGFISLAVISVLIYGGYVSKAKAHRLLTIQRNQIVQQRKAIEDKNKELKNSNNELNGLNEELVELNKEKNELINMLSHDLRSPANNILGLTTVFQLENEEMNPSQQRIIQNISNESDRLNRMISKILDLEAIEDHKTNIKYEPVNLSKVLNRVVDNFSVLLDSHKISVNKTFDETLTFRGDKLYTLLIFENLISNAIKYSPANSQIDLNVEKRGNKVHCTVKDQGPGLKKSDHEIIFTKFTKLQNNSTKGEKSYGLGLSIVKKYVEQMNGSVWCESEVGKGANFIVEFELL